MILTKYIAISPNSRIEFLSEQERNDFIAANEGYTNGGMVEEEIIEPEPVKQPREVALWRVKSILTLQGMAAGVEAAINQMPEPNKTVAKIAWEYAYTIDRWSETVLFAQQQLGLTDEQVDALFDAAEAIEI